MELEKVRVGDWVKFTKLGVYEEGVAELDIEYKVTGVVETGFEFKLPGENNLYWWVSTDLHENDVWYAEYEIVKRGIEMKKVKVGDWVKFTEIGDKYVGVIHLHKEYKVIEVNFVSDSFKIHVQDDDVRVNVWISPELPENNIWYAEYEIVKRGIEMEKVRVGDWVKFTSLDPKYEGKVSLNKEYEVLDVDGIGGKFAIGAGDAFIWITSYDIIKIVKPDLQTTVSNDSPKEVTDYDFSISCRSIINQMDKLTKEDQQDLLALLNHRYFRGSNA